MKKIFTIILLLISLNLFSQKNSVLSIEAHYPVTIGNNFVNKGFIGILDLGSSYNFLYKSNFKFGINTNLSFLRYTLGKDFGQPTISGYSIIIQPRIYVEYTDERISNFHFITGIGYSFININIYGSIINNSLGVQEVDYNYKYGGLNFNAGMSYDLTNKFFIKTQFDYIKLLNTEADVPNISYNTQVMLLKLGIGYRI